LTFNQKKREKCIWFFKLQTIISLFKIQFLKHHWGEAHERFERVRVFHAHPFSSFSRNSYRDLRWVRGSHFTEEKSKLAETVTFRKKKFSKISFIFSKCFGYGKSKFWVRRTQFWVRRTQFWVRQLWVRQRPQTVSEQRKRSGGLRRGLGRVQPQLPQLLYVALGRHDTALPFVPAELGRPANRNLTNWLNLL